MARPRKTVELPGQESTETAGDVTGEQTSNTDQPEVVTVGADSGTGIQQKVSDLLDGTAQAERNAILSTLNEQAAAIVTRFEELGFTDIVGHPLTNSLEFLDLVKAATQPVLNLTSKGFVTNEEGKQQPAAGKPVLTEHGWHVPG